MTVKDEMEPVKDKGVTTVRQLMGFDESILSTDVYEIQYLITFGLNLVKYRRMWRLRW